jgi:IclR family transcriptional regulator, acetate operon repressor
VKNRPAYAITSVDHALQLATVLQLEGPLTVSDAAERLGVARSTAHRLLGMLCYRDFAVQDDDRRYRAGPVLARSGTAGADAARVRTVSLPHLADLTEALDETSNLTVLSGRHVRFLASVECSQVLRVGTREGMAFPAHLTSGGLAMLATLSREEVEARYADLPGDADVADAVPSMAALRRQLALVRDRGFALNDGRTERGIVALGRVVREDGAAVAAVSVSLPSTRFSRDGIPRLSRAVASTVAAIERDLRRPAGRDDGT